MKPKPRLIILHSFGRTSRDNWYQAVGQQLADLFEIVIPDLPDPEAGRISDWLPALAALRPDAQTWLVGHSLGGTLILRYLEQAEAPIAGCVLVAAPANDLARNDLHATGFFERDFDWAAIQAKAPTRLIIGSADDQTVPFWQAEYLAANAKGQLIRLEGYDHFKADHLPELVTLLKEHVHGQK